LLFSPEPKSRREDLYDRERELEELNMFLRGSLGPMALLLGLRRTGKTSLLKVSLSEFKGPTITVDMRKIEEKGTISYRDFIKLLQEGINNITKGWRSTIIEALRKSERSGNLRPQGILGMGRQKQGNINGPAR